MTDCREEINSSAETALAPPHKLGPHLGHDQLEEHPELIAVVTRAVDEVLANSNISRERKADLVDEAEQAAAAAALSTYQRMVFAAIQASDAADEIRRALGPMVAAAAAGIADVVTDAATEMHNVEEAAAEHVRMVAANAAADLAALVAFDDEIAASTAVALVLKAVSEAAAVNTMARADAASSVAQAAADAAAEVADQAASTALAAEQDVIANAFNRHLDALETCHEVAAAAARAVLTHQYGVHLPEAHQPPEI